MVEKKIDEPIWFETGEGPDIEIHPPAWVEHIRWIAIGTRDADSK